MRRLQLVTRTELQAPVSKVFDFVADHTNAPRWQSGIDEIRRITPPGPIGVGTEHELKRRFAGTKVVARNRFIAYEPGRFVAFEIPSGKMTGVASYLVEPTGANTCRLISTVDFQVAGAGPIRRTPSDADLQARQRGGLGHPQGPAGAPLSR